MKFTTLAATLAISVQVTNAIPLEILNYFYRRSSSSSFQSLPKFALSYNTSSISANGSNSTYGNSTYSNSTYSNSSSAGGYTNVSNVTNSSNSTTSLGNGLPDIKLYSFSDEFTALYNNDTSSEKYSNVTLFQILEDDGIFEVANLIDYTEIANVSSADLNSTSLLSLYAQIQEDFEDDEIDGAVVLVGSQYIEDAAFFLDLVLNASIPVVLTTEVTGLNLASTGGSLLTDAIRVAADSDAAERGTLVVATGGKIISGFYETPATPPQGQTGAVYEKTVQWYYTAAEVPTAGTDFDVSELAADGDSLPLVPTIYNYNGFSSEIIAGIQQVGTVEGLVLVNSESQDGFTSSVESAIDSLAAEIPVVISNSIAGSTVSSEDLASNSTIAAGILDPIKARILLQVALASDYNTTEIKTLFSTVYGG